MVVSLDRRPIDSRSHHGDQRYGDQRYADPRNADPRMARQRQNASMARAAVKQRRQNILFMLAGSTAVTGLLWMMTKSASVAYAFVLSLCLFAGYVYLLAQSRKVDVPRVSREYYNRAA
jgi:Flp pilus assembly protein TadB